MKRLNSKRFYVVLVFLVLYLLTFVALLTTFKYNQYTPNPYSFPISSEVTQNVEVNPATNLTTQKVCGDNQEIGRFCNNCKTAQVTYTKADCSQYQTFPYDVNCSHLCGPAGPSLEEMVQLFKRKVECRVLLNPTPECVEFLLANP